MNTETLGPIYIEKGPTLDVWSAENAVSLFQHVAGGCQKRLLDMDAISAKILSDQLATAAERAQTIKS